jgi:hypothetical protein
MTAHQDRRNGQRDAALLEDVEHRRAPEHAGQGLAQHGVALPHVAAPDEHAPDRAGRAFDPVAKDLATVVAV